MAASRRAIAAVLDRVNWDFPQASTSAGTVHALHWFPGNFIPEIPSYFIQLLTKPNDLVMDCFCGSGTTGVEALQLGRRVWQSDINAASLQVATGKVAALSVGRDNPELEHLLRELTWDTLAVSDSGGTNDEGTDPELKVWISGETLRQLKFIWQLIEKYRPDQPERMILEMLFTDTLFKCAGGRGAVTRTGLPRRHHWGWIADNVAPSSPASHNAIAMFRNAIVACSQVNSVPVDPRRITIVREDARSLSIEPGTVDLVMTSPPYAGVIDYALANRLTYLWMNWPLARDRGDEIGSRRNRTKQRFLEDYLLHIQAAVDSIASALRPGGYCALVIGASRRFPSAAQAVVELFGRSLEPAWGPTSREPLRRRVSDRHGRPSTELVCVFRRE